MVNSWYLTVFCFFFFKKMDSKRGDFETYTATLWNSKAQFQAAKLWKFLILRGRSSHVTCKGISWAAVLVKQQQDWLILATRKNPDHVMAKQIGLTISNIVKLWQNMTVCVDLTASNVVRLWQNMSFCVNYLLSAMSNLCLCKRHRSFMPLKMALSMSWRQGELAPDAQSGEGLAYFPTIWKQAQRTFF